MNEQLKVLFFENSKLLWAKYKFVFDYYVKKSNQYISYI